MDRCVNVNVHGLAVCLLVPTGSTDFWAGLPTGCTHLWLGAPLYHTGTGTPHALHGVSAGDEA